MCAGTAQWYLKENIIEHTFTVLVTLDINQTILILKSIVDVLLEGVAHFLCGSTLSSFIVLLSVLVPILHIRAIHFILLENPEYILFYTFTLY